MFSRMNPFYGQNGKLTTTKSGRHKHGFGIQSIWKIFTNIRIFHTAFQK
ncbi:MAG: ATP-binding protein [Lachnospiraceae bacterium]|nr:ATP-binding protein [Lachnospiraceae bacterium]